MTHTLYWLYWVGAFLGVVAALAVGVLALECWKSWRNRRAS